MLLIRRAEVEKLLDLDQMIAALERGFVEYSAGRCHVPPRIGARSARGLVGAMPGYVPGVGLEVKLVAVFPANEGKPTHQGFIALFDENDGIPLALMDAEHITAVRTGGSTAVAVRLLARKDAEVLTILGAGVQGHSHLETVTRVRKFRDVRVASRRTGESFEKAVRGADVVCLCTDAKEPIIEKNWVSPGALVTSVGFNAEVPRDLVDASALFVEWRGAATNPQPAGAAELQGRQNVTELGEVLSKAKPGRTSEDQIILYKSTGLAVEDAVTARLVYERALKEGAGTQIEL